jgi:predicted nucleotidyltransferase
VDVDLEPLLTFLDGHDPGGTLGLYLYGSAVTGGLRPGSDVDLLMVTRRSLSAPERAALTRTLLGLSGWSGHAERFPEVAARRPLELTSLVADDLRSPADPPRRDYQYGEWLRERIVEGEDPAAEPDPDVPILARTAWAGHRVLRGAPLAEAVPEPSDDVVRRAMLDLVPQILVGLDEDDAGAEVRHALLTLARILTTLETGTIVPKDEAAARVRDRLPPVHRPVLALARDEYRGGPAVDWSVRAGEVRAAAAWMAAVALRSR